MKYFVDKHHIVRKIWGKSDTILLIFAGSAAEFALNKAVDWLYFTGKLPADPLGRLFSTVNYAQKIVFATEKDAIKAISHINAIHQGVEQSRAARIPDWAYRDVLFMLIDYSIRAYELMERKLSKAEKIAVFKVFMKLGALMQLQELPSSYTSWLTARKQHLETDLISSIHTVDLYKQYRRSLGSFRFTLLKQLQVLLVPKHVQHLLKIGPITLLRPLVYGYKFSRIIGFDRAVKKIILPAAYQQQIKALDC